MSTLAQALPDAPAEAQRPPLVSRLGFLRRNGWGLADQGLISATNFVTQMLPARALDRGEFGMFSVINTGMFFANIFQSSLVTQAHNVIGATLHGPRYRRYTASTALAQVIVCAVEIVLAVPLAILAYARGWMAAPMLVALIPAIVFWQLQEFVRRVLYTEGRYSAAFLNDMISYGGQTLLLAALYGSWVKYGTPFTGALAFYALAVTSAAAVVLGVWQLRHSLAKHLDHKAFGENWHFGKWLLGGDLMSFCSTIHVQVWWAALLLGAWASADLRAAQILFGPARVIAFFLCTVLPIRFARTLHNGGQAAMHAQLRQVLGWLVPTGGLYCAVLAMFPRPLLHLVYGPGYDATEAAKVLTLYSVSAFLGYVQMVIAAALTASRRTRTMFAGNACGCAVALVLSPLCIKMFGATGAIVSMIATTVVVTLMFVVAYRDRSREAEVAGFDVLAAAAADQARGAVEEPV